MKGLFTFCLFLGVIFRVQAGKVDTLDIYSPSMHKSSRCVLIRPDSYSPENAPYPVLYLLHGWSGNYSGWLKSAPQLKQHADQYQLLIVCPDGGYDSWYLDSPVDSTQRYETYIAKEVVAFIDSAFHTMKSRNGRAIAGLSMGGHGALYLAARNPDVFGAAGSMAGGLDLRPFRKNNWDLEGVLGTPDKFWENWEVHSVVNLTPLFKSADVAIIIDCGIDDFFLQVNRDMHQELLQAGIDHDYTERPGKHNGAYWGSAVDYQVLFFYKYFER